MIRVYHVICFWMFYTWFVSHTFLAETIKSFIPFSMHILIPSPWFLFYFLELCTNNVVSIALLLQFILFHNYIVLLFCIFLFLHYHRNYQIVVTVHLCTSLDFDILYFVPIFLHRCCRLQIFPSYCSPF